MRLPELKIPDEVAGAVYAATGIVAATIVISKLCKRSALDAIPTVGSSGWLGVWVATRYNYRYSIIKLIEEGYEKYKHKPFKIARENHWYVIMGSREHMDEIRKAPDELLSSIDASNESLQAKYTLGEEVANNPYHVGTIQSQLTRNIGNCYADIRDEIVTAFDEILDLEGHEWKNVPALTTIQKVVCRTSNRLFVGLPLCRNLEWIDLNVQFTLEVLAASQIIRRFPAFLAPLAAYFMTDVPRSTQRGMKHLQPVIEERLKMLEEYGDDWSDKPNDFVSWLLEDAVGSERSVENLTRRVLAVNFAAIHTSSISFSHVLFKLVTNPQYIQPLREEVESIVGEEGWTKASIGKMRKIDSFLRETQRIEGLGYLSLTRKVRTDYTFSDGTFVSKGTFVISPSRLLHLEEENYENAHVFDPFRFSNIREEDGEGTKHQFVATSLQYLPFGHGKHACPGRFFAANELKTMLAHIVVTYDITLEDNTAPPKANFSGAANIPDPFAKVMFRKRLG